MRSLLFLLACASLAIASTAMRSGWPSCIVELRGTPSGIAGRFACSGGSVFAALHRSIRLRPGTFHFEGLENGDRSCERPGCLITICRDSRAIIQATVSNVTFPGQNPSIFFLGDRTDVYFTRPLFISNKAIGIYAAQHSTVHILGGVFKDGVAPSGAGFIASGNSTVEIDSSSFVNNTA